MKINTGTERAGTYLRTGVMNLTDDRNNRIIKCRKELTS